MHVQSLSRACLPSLCLAFAVELDSIYDDDEKALTAEGIPEIGDAWPENEPQLSPYAMPLSTYRIIENPVCIRRFISNSSGEGHVMVMCKFGNGEETSK